MTTTSVPTSRERVERAAEALTKQCDLVEAGSAPHSSLTPLEMELRKAKAARDVAISESGQLSKGFPSEAGGLAETKSIGGGLGGAVIRSGFDLKSRPTATVSAFDVLTKGVTLPASADWSSRAAGIVPVGRDRRFLWPHLLIEDAGVDTSIEDFRQTARSLVGSVERAIDATTVKASLSSTIVLVTEAMRQHAVTIDDIPNSLFDSVPKLASFLGTEGQFAVEQSLDAHCLAQITAAAPPFGITGTGIVEQLRNGISAMRALGANPTLAVLNPADSAALDVLADAGGYVFPLSGAGASSPLFGLTVVEHTGVGNAPPMLIDPQMLGAFFLGTMQFAADPYTGFKANLTTLRIETNGLFHVRNANGARRIAAT